MVQRTEYLEKLLSWKEEQVIKVITGIRRCGKSTLLLQYQEYLRRNGITEEQIVSVNFEELEYEELLDYKKLYSYLKRHLAVGKTTYIFLDEIQKVPSFEKVVDSLYVKPDIDIYITGSNAYLLSGDLATFLTGRYDLGFSMENVVYFELLRRGYRVNVGKYGDTEVDFVAEQQGIYTYFQVTADMTAEETFEREMRPFYGIRDNYEKIVLTLDHMTPGNYNGIQVIFLLDWLLS